MKKNIYLNRRFYLILLIIAFISFTLLSRLFTSDFITNYSTDYLDSKKVTVSELSAASLASSAAVTLLPGDVGTPIADKLADLSMYSLIVLSAIMLEKYLTVIIGTVMFRWLIPIFCIIAIIIKIMTNKEEFIHKAYKTMTKIICVGLVFYTLIPLSVSICKVIDLKFDTSITETIDTANEDAKEVQDNAKDENILEAFISKISGGLKGLTSQFEKTLNNLLEAFAVMLVTSCLIPILVFIIMIWIIKAVFHLDTKEIIYKLPSKSNNRIGIQ